jgi:hypothetical protein
MDDTLTLAGESRRRSRRHRSELLHRRQPQQAAVENLLRPGKAGWLDPARDRRLGGAHLALAGTQNQWHRAPCDGEAGHAGHHDHRRPCGRRSRAAASPLRPQLSPSGCMLPLTVSTIARWSPVPNRVRSVVKPPSSATCIHAATAARCLKYSRSYAPGWPTTCAARAIWPAPSASSCASRIFVPSRATSACRSPPPTPLPIRRAATDCLRRVPLDQRLRLLGVKTSGLVPAEGNAARETSLQAELIL